ncbi:hemin uptake protein HemP [Bartonella sp. W8122]|uniref:hemin uptake protein HemP n=1 Tax=Bartonella TaxID=773 RepID=UPI0018DC3639|nr:MULTISPECIES: hemin uptake protein HemP [Bartonella]MBI0001233.1 hemin uptake protein HemP [Bartonella sp. W8122]MBI0025710.1 hemin uptake protein HemP [Bartonella apihabitans]
MMGTNTKRQSDGRLKAAPLTIDSKALFGANNEILILHDGATYRLKITRFGKLILNK